MKVISLDLDGVLLDFIKSYKTCLEDCFNFKTDKTTTNCYSFSDWQSPIKTKDVVTKMFETDMYRTMSLIEPDAPEVLYKLRSSGHSILFNTSRGYSVVQPYTSAYEKMYIDTVFNLAALGLYDGNVDNLVMLPDKYMKNITVHVDDHKPTVLDLKSKNLRTLLFDAPYNKPEEVDLFTIRHLPYYI